MLRGHELNKMLISFELFILYNYKKKHKYIKRIQCMLFIYHFQRRAISKQGNANQVTVTLRLYAFS